MCPMIEQSNHVPQLTRVSVNQMKIQPQKELEESVRDGSGVVLDKWSIHLRSGSPVCGPGVRAQSGTDLSRSEEPQGRRIRISGSLRGGLG